MNKFYYRTEEFQLVSEGESYGDWMDRKRRLDANKRSPYDPSPSTSVYDAFSSNAYTSDYSPSTDSSSSSSDSFSGGGGDFGGGGSDSSW